MKRNNVKYLIVNASPLITLAKAGHLDLFFTLAHEVLLPQAVVDEIMSGPTDDPARRVLEKGWGKREPPMETPPLVQEWSLGAGESAVITLALHKKGWAVLDDAKGRMCARTLGVPLIGTLGLVLQAKKKGKIGSAAVVMKDLSAAGLYFNERTARLILKNVHEEWGR